LLEYVAQFGHPFEVSEVPEVPEVSEVSWVAFETCGTFGTSRACNPKVKIKRVSENLELDSVSASVLR
jgi:hypothetical protein